MTKNKLDLIFKSYDIRGVYGDSIDQAIAYKIGKAFAEFVLDDSIIVGHDGRVSNIEMLDAFTSGIKSINKEIIYVGLVPTDTVYSLSGLLKKPGAIITASHNPKNYNGLKLCNAGAIPIGEDSGLLDIKKLADRNVEIRIEKFQNNVKYLGNEYYEHLKNLVSPESISQKLNFGIDGGNGVFGAVFDTLNNIYKFNVKSIYLEVDGNFPNHHPDPTVPKNMEQLIKSVKDNSCDIGLAFDGDGDRLGVVDNLGNLVWADQYMLLLCTEIANLYDNPKIIMDVKCSKVFFDEAKKLNCDPIMSKTGHSPIKEKMKELNSPLSGEMSGHVCYADDFYGYDDEMYVALRLLRILCNQEKNGLLLM